MAQFSIIIPSWNNLEYLQLCIASLKKNSHYSNQIIVYVNDGSDGSLDWIRLQAGVEFIHAPKNEGICIAVNSCRALVNSDYIVYMNDDMYVCPDWDRELFKEIGKIGHDRFMLSATVIEPKKINNPNLISIIRDFGDSVKNFKENELLQQYDTIPMEDWFGASWPPSVVSTRLWDIVGGYSIEFSPGMYSDPDFSMKLWMYGVRIFKGVGKSKAYHFQSKSTGKVKRNKGNEMFLLKWGISANAFYTHYLNMGEPYNPTLVNKERMPILTVAGNTLKRMYKSFKYKPMF
jgi:glycosyltransferase involved in cell wall biosynthesis